MTAKYFAILTNQGAAKLANATALGTKLNLTQLAVGDGNGVLPTPDAAQTKLINQKRIKPLNVLSVDPNNSSQIIAEQIIPENEGGFWIREIGLYDDEGVLIAVANCPETYKPQLQEGSGRTQTIRMILIVSSTSAVSLKIDPAVVLATRQYVDDKALELKVYVDDLMAKHIAALDPHSQYAQKASPTLTGTPKAPTPAAGNDSTQIATTGFVQAALLSKAPLASPALTGKPTAPTPAHTVNDTQIATTAFVKSAIAALVSSAPAALDTLGELAAALGNDPNFSATLIRALAGKQPLDNTLTDLSGKTVAGILDYLHLGDGSALPAGVPVPYPLATPPDGWLKCNGALFDKVKYPKLAAAYPSGSLPDLRGEFLRGWDDGRGVDAGRGLLSAQSDAVQNITGSIGRLQMFRDVAYSGPFSITDSALTTGLTPSTNGGYGAANFSFDISRVARTAAETRARNVAFNYIVRAA